MFDIRHKERVNLIKIPERYLNRTDCPIRLGQLGVVIEMTKMDDGPHYLVKWVGRSWPVSVHRNDLERA